MGKEGDRRALNWGQNTAYYTVKKQYPAYTHPYPQERHRLKNIITLATVHCSLFTGFVIHLSTALITII